MAQDETVTPSSQQNADVPTRPAIVIALGQTEGVSPQQQTQEPFVRLSPFQRIDKRWDRPSGKDD